MQDEVNQEESEVDGMKKGADSTGKAMHMRKSGGANEEDTDGRPRVTVDVERSYM